MTIAPTYLRNSNVLSAPSATGEVMMMAIENSRFYGATEVGARVWDLLETSHSIAALCATLRHEFSVDEATCTVELTRFVDELVKEGLAARSQI